MSVILVGRYLEDRSTTSISYKHYNDKPEDKYPTYSICFKGTNFYWRHDFKIFDEYGLYSYQLKEMLKGEPTFSYEHDRISKLYKKIPTSFKNDLKINAFHFNLKDILVETSFTGDDSRRYVLNKNFSTTELLEDQPFHLDYQTPDMICFTRDSKHYIDTIRLEDVIVLNETMQYNAYLFPYKNITYEDASIDIYIHYPGQLIRSLDTPSFTSSFPEYHWNEILEMKLSQGTILRKRSDSISQCNHEILNYDLYLRKSICTKDEIRCIPPFWKTNLQDVLNLKACTTQKQLKGIYKYISNHKELLANHDSPCIDMYNSIVWNWNAKQGVSPNQVPGQAIIKILYKEKYYEEIQYLRAFDVEGFISNLGGFVGIFLGYSMMQLPDLLGITIV